MSTLKKYITFNDIPYDKLNQVEKIKIDLFITKLKDAGLEDKILTYDEGKYSYAITDNKEHSTNLPNDLTKEIDKVWVHLKD